METIKAGCILIDKNKKKVALVYRNYYNDYSFPKGHFENGESILECAIRETEEETKRVPLIIKKEPVYVEKYKTPSGEECICYMYLAVDNGESNNKSLDTHPVEWVDIDEVYNKLSYNSLKEMWVVVKDKFL